MDVERYQLLGDSSLYVKNACNVKQPLKGDLEWILGGPTEVTYEAGGGAKEILQAGCRKAFWGLRSLLHFRRP